MTTAGVAKIKETFRAGGDLGVIVNQIYASMDAAIYNGPAIGTYASNDAGSVKAFYDWLGIVPAGSFGDCHIGRGDYNPAGTFQGEMNDWMSADWPMTQSGWIGAGRELRMAVPMFPLSGNFTDALAGAYDSAITTIATKIKNLLDATQTEFHIRFGWEMNGSFQPWAIADKGAGTNIVNATKASQYAAWWRRARALFLAVSPKFKMCFCTNLLYYDYRAAWPGDDQVDYIGVDTYPAIGNTTYVAPNAVSADAQTALWNNVRTSPFGLDDVAAFAATKGKPLLIPEFGIQFENGQVFMDLFYNWLVANKVKDIGWWNANAGGVNSIISSGNIPNTGACVRYRWNNALYTTQPSTPVYVPTNRITTDLTTWTRNGGLATVVAGQTSPSGSPVYALRPLNTDSVIHRIYKNVNWPAATAIKVRIEFKADGINYALLNGARGPDTGMVCFDLVNGVVSAGQDGNASITSLGNGWYSAVYNGITAQGFGYPYIHLNKISGGEQAYPGVVDQGILVGKVEFLV
jgi:hypothetical protein